LCQTPPGKQIGPGVTVLPLKPLPGVDVRERDYRMIDTPDRGVDDLAAALPAREARA
jgi:hypothetical protein